MIAIHCESIVLSVLLNQSSSRLTDIECPLSPPAGRITQRLPSHFILQQRDHRRGQSLGIISGKQNRSIPFRRKDLARPADIGRHDRQATCRRFQQHAP